MKARLLAALALVSLAACSSTRTSMGEAERPGRDASFVFIVTAADEAELTAEERAEAFDGHFANMARLAEEGVLLVSGPFGEPKADRLHRGLFILDEARIERAQEYAWTDPTARAGVFDMHVYPFRSASPLFALPALYEADKARMKALDPDGPEWDMRNYVLLMAEDGEAGAAALADTGLVLFSGSFGGEIEGQSLFAIDTEDAGAVGGLLGLDLDDPSVGWSVLPWYGSVCIAQLAGAG